jgi:beta-N-acetylhexosaminidase
MHLVDEGKLTWTRTWAITCPKWRASMPTHAKMELRDILTHQAGLRAFVPFYTKLQKSGKLRPELVSDTATETHNVRVAQGLYIPRRIAIACSRG